MLNEKLNEYLSISEQVNKQNGYLQNEVVSLREANSNLNKSLEENKLKTEKLTEYNINTEKALNEKITSLIEKDVKITSLRGRE